MKLKFKKIRISTEMTVDKDYSSFTAFEAGIQGKSDLIVGIISLTPQILSEIKTYLANKFYEIGPKNLCLFTDTGLLLGYTKKLEWVQVQEELKTALDIQKLPEDTLCELIEECLEKKYWASIKEERQEVVDLILKEAFQKLAEKIALNINYLDNIEWRDLERMLGEALSVIGFNVKVTPPSKDGGKDIIATTDVFNKKYSFILELKHWRVGKKVGFKHVEKFLRVVINEKSSGGLFLASYGYTNDCTEAIASFKRYNLNLGDGDKIYSIFELYKQRIDGLVLAPEKLVKLLSSGLEENIGAKQ